MLDEATILSQLATPAAKEIYVPKSFRISPLPFTLSYPKI
jgi:hypothetical protein